MFCGDLIHVPAAQFARPELTWAYDLDQSIARATRINLLREASNTQAWLAAAHMAKPGIGRWSKKVRIRLPADRVRQLRQTFPAIVLAMSMRTPGERR